MGQSSGSLEMVRCQKWWRHVTNCCVNNHRNFFSSFSSFLSCSSHRRPWCRGLLSPNPDENALIFLDQWTKNTEWKCFLLDVPRLSTYLIPPGNSTDLKTILQAKQTRFFFFVCCYPSAYFVYQHSGEETSMTREEKNVWSFRRRKILFFLFLLSKIPSRGNPSSTRHAGHTLPCGCLLFSAWQREKKEGRPCRMKTSKNNRNQECFTFWHTVPYPALQLRGGNEESKRKRTRLGRKSREKFKKWGGKAMRTWLKKMPIDEITPPTSFKCRTKGERAQPAWRIIKNKSVSN